MDKVYFTENTMELRIWIFENISYKYFRLENWLHMDVKKEYNWLIMSKPIGVLVGLVPEHREHEEIGPEEFKRHAKKILTNDIRYEFGGFSYTADEWEDVKKKAYPIDQ